MSFKPLPSLTSFLGSFLTFRHLLTKCLLAIGAGWIVVVALQAFAGNQPEESTSVEGARDPLPVQTEPAELVSHAATRRTYTGITKAARSSELGLDRTGKLIEVLVDEGGRVEVGQVLARLDTRSLQAKREELLSNQRMAEANLRELRQGPRAEVIAAARARVKELASISRLREIDHQRNARMLPNDAVSQSSFDSSRFELEASQNRVESAQLELAELEAGTRVEQIDAQVARVDQLTAAIADIDVMLADSQLTAPYAGRIAKRYVDEGSVIRPGESIVRLVETDVLEAWIGFPPDTISHVLEMRTTSLMVAGDTFAAHVHAVIPELDPETRTQTVIFRFPAEAIDHVVPSQVVRLELDQTLAVEGYRLPIDALVRGRRGLWGVFVAEKTNDLTYVAKRRDVEVLHSEGAWVIVRGTIQTGELIVTRGAHRLANDALVQVDSAQEDSAQKNSVQVDSAQEDSAQEDSVQVDQVQEDSVQHQE